MAREIEYTPLADEKVDIENEALLHGDSELGLNSRRTRGDRRRTILLWHLCLVLIFASATIFVFTKHHFCAHHRKNLRALGRHGHEDDLHTLDLEHGWNKIKSGFHHWKTESHVPIAQFKSLRRHSKNCRATIPVEEVPAYQFNTTEFGRVHFYAIGEIASDIHVIDAEGEFATVNAEIFVSHKKLAQNVTFTETREQDGRVSYKLNAPLALKKKKCIRAQVTLAIPTSVTNLPVFLSNFISGEVSLSESVANRIHFDYFNIGAVKSHVEIPALNAKVAVIATVFGSVNATAQINEISVMESVFGDVFSHVEVVDQSAFKSAIFRSVKGTVHGVLSSNYNGHFTAKSLLSESSVVSENESAILDFSRSTNRFKSGTKINNQDDAISAAKVEVAAVKGAAVLIFE